MQTALGLLAGLALLILPTSGGQPGAAGPVVAFAQAGTGDPTVLALMQQINRQLRTAGRNIAVEHIEFFTIGAGRPANRLHQQEMRWVPNDSRRNAQGTALAYLVDQSDGATASGLSSTQTEAAIDRALATWQQERCLRNMRLVKRPDPGIDPDIFDAFFHFGTFGTPFLADIVNAGWLPKAFFEAVGGPGGGDGILAFSVSFVFLDATGNPTDLNGDHYLDTAFNEVYYNDYFPWGINTVLPSIDVQTVALHENGHSLGIDHFGPPPAAIMNPIYAGVRQSPFPTDHASMCTVWGSWPNR